MTYEEEKARVEKFFKRPLSDREFAEALLGKIEYILGEVECLGDSYENAVRDLKDSIEDLKNIRNWV